MRTFDKSSLPDADPNSASEPSVSDIDRTVMQRLTKILRVHGLSLLIVVALVCLSYPGWFSSQALSFDDLTRLNAPQRIFVGSMWHSGHVPLWNPYNFGGQPFLAAGQSGPLYPLNIIFVFLPIVLAMKVSYIVHGMIAGVSMYLIGHYLTKRRIPAIASGVIFAASGFMIGHQIHTQMFDAMSLVPLCLYFLMKLLDRPVWGHIVGLAVAVALELYAGHPQVTLYLFIVLFLYSFVVLVVTWRTHIFKRLFAILFAGALSLMLAAPQWLTTVKLIPYSDRTVTSQAFLMKASLPVQGLLQFLSPFTAGGGYTGIPFAQNFASLYGVLTFWELSCYVGLTSLLLAVTAVCVRSHRQPAVVAFLVIGVLGILLALGKYGPMHYLLLHAPGLDLFRIPGRYTVLTQLSIAALCAIGINVLVEAVHEHKKAPLVCLFAVSAAVTGLDLWASNFGPLALEPVWAATVPVVICVATSGIAWVLWIGRIPQAWLTSGMLVLLVSVDVVVQAASWSGFVMGNPAGYTSPTAADQFLSRHLSKAQPMEKVIAMPDTSLAFDASTSFGIPTLNGYDSLEASWYVKDMNLTWDTSGILSEPRTLMDALGVRYLLSSATVIPVWATQNDGVTQIHRWTKVPPSANALEVDIGSVSVPGTPSYGPLLSVTLLSGSQHVSEYLTGLSNQRFLIPVPLNWPHQQQTEVIMQNETWQEQVEITSATWLTTQSVQRPMISNVSLNPEPWTPVHSDSSEIVWKNDDAKSGAYVTTNPDDPLTAHTGTATPVAIEPNQQTWRVESNAAATFVLGQTYDPGWQATVDGKPVQVKQLHSQRTELMTGIPVPQGSHTVHLTYHPPGFRTGLLMLLTGILIITVITVVRKTRPNKKRLPPSP